MLVGFVAIAQAQQGRVGINTTTPAATLDVVANTTDTARPDALLVPRMTRAQLYAKDNAYVAAQNGAIVFVTTIDGTATTKTANVTATGFYYYDAPNAVWKAVGGNTALQYRIREAQAASATYDWSNTNFDYWEFNSGSELYLGNPALFTGRTIYVRNSSAGTIQFTGTELTTRPRNVVAITSQSSMTLYSNGTAWYLISGRN
ncbi:hypothetical protein [Chryseobacterium arachidis]|nr:hypothetical protein [Chryseobacterium arachidis]